MIWVYKHLQIVRQNQFGGLDQLADRSLRMREVPGSKPGFSIFSPFRLHEVLTIGMHARGGKRAHDDDMNTFSIHAPTQLDITHARDFLLLVCSTLRAAAKDGLYNFAFFVLSECKQKGPPESWQPQFLQDGKSLHK